MARRQGSGTSQNGSSRRRGRWARNAAEAQERAASSRRSRPMSLEDHHTRGKRIRDVGQNVPKGYMRTGGRYFAKVANMRAIKSKTTAAQRAMVAAHRERFYGADGESGWLRAAGNSGMYDANTSEANFRRTSSARKLIDGNGGTYGPDYHPSRAGQRRRGKSRYIIAFGQDGHMR